MKLLPLQKFANRHFDSNDKELTSDKIKCPFGHARFEPGNSVICQEHYRCADLLEPKSWQVTTQTPVLQVSKLQHEDIQIESKLLGGTVMTITCINCKWISKKKTSQQNLVL